MFQQAQQVFGVQFRDMHTAIHNVAIFESREDAKAVFGVVAEGELGIGDACDVIGCTAKNVIEINFRNPINEYRGHPLQIVNPEKQIPDLY
ncbi:hypothetical protein ACI2KR_31685 [Pseudomonas luteola]